MPLVCKAAFLCVCTRLYCICHAEGGWTNAVERLTQRIGGGHCHEQKKDRYSSREPLSALHCQLRRMQRATMLAFILQLRAGCLQGVHCSDGVVKQSHYTMSTTKRSTLIQLAVIFTSTEVIYPSQDVTARLLEYLIINVNFIDSLNPVPDLTYD